MHYSIIIPTKNRPDFLRTAVLSALNACGSEDEVLVVDDGGSICAIDSLSMVTDERLKVYVNKGVAGCSGARNEGVGLARNELIFFLDDDDVLCAHYPQFVSLQVLKEYPECHYGFSAFEELKDSSQMPQYKITQGELLSKLAPRRRLSGLGVGFWIKKSSFQQAGGLDIQLSVNEDTEFCIRLLELKLEGWYSEIFGTLIRVNHTDENNAGHVTRQYGYKRRFENFKKIYEQHQAFLHSVPDVERFVVRRLFQDACKSGNFDYAQQLIKIRNKITDKIKSFLQLRFWQMYHYLGRGGKWRRFW